MYIRAGLYSRGYDEKDEKSIKRYFEEKENFKRMPKKDIYLFIEEDIQIKKVKCGAKRCKKFVPPMDVSTGMKLISCAEVENIIKTQKNSMKYFWLLQGELIERINGKKDEVMTLFTLYSSPKDLNVKNLLKVMFGLHKEYMFCNAHFAIERLIK